MTPERKDQLFDAMLRFIRSDTDSNATLYSVLHDGCDMTMEELHECGIDYLDSFFPEDAKTLLKNKIQNCFSEYKERWLRKRPDVLIEEAEEIASVQRMFKELPDAVTEEDAEYLLRFKNPLEVVSDSWQSMNGSGTVVDDDMSYILWDLRDKQSAEFDYELEPEYYGQPAPSSPELSPQMSM